MSGRSTRRSAAAAGYDDRPKEAASRPQENSIMSKNNNIDGEGLRASQPSSGRTSPSHPSAPAKRQRTAAAAASHTASTKGPLSFDLSFACLHRQLKKEKKKVPIRVSPRYDTAGDVFVVGTGDCGQLGLGEDVVEKARPAILRFFDELEIIDVVAGGMHNLVLSRDGKVLLVLLVCPYSE